MSLTPRYEWKHRHEFAEIAESLGVSTELILAALPYRDRVTVLWTPTDREDSPVWSAVFRRSEGHILKQVGSMRMVAASAKELFNEQEIRKHIERNVKSMPLAEEGDEEQEEREQGEDESGQAP